jgi:hypothetical protein
MRKEKRVFESKYVIFYFGRGFDISFELCGYFDNRPRINLDLFFFNLALILPFRNKWTDECVPPKWGIAYHNQTFWIYRGGNGNMKGGNRWRTYHMPWSLDWVRTSALRKDDTWEHERKGDRKDFYEDKWKEVLRNEKYPYTYTLKSGEVQDVEATVMVEEREWRRRAFKWLPLFNKVSRTIDIAFNKEVGEGTGSWKGGVLGCGYELLPSETPLDALKRMEKERKFGR